MTWLSLIQKVKQFQGVSAIASGVAAIAIAGSFTGIYQTFEWSILDRWFQIRPAETKDSRIVVVEITESDISELGEWPVSDGVLAQLLSTIKEQKPRVIGLDIYRDIKHGDILGQQKLAQIFQSTPNLIGVYKAIGQTVKPPPILAAKGQVGMADLVLDEDGKIRRALISAEFNDGEIALGLGAITSLIFLEQDGILLEDSPRKSDKVLGKTTITAFESNTGAYVDADADGYQTLLDYRGKPDSFLHTSLTDVLQGNIPEDLFRDRLVLIGTTAPSLNDFFYTPYNDNGSSQMPGVYIHANIASQMIAGALDERTMLGGISERSEWLWILGWSVVGGSLSLVLFKMDLLQNNPLNSIKFATIGIFVPIGVLFGSSYILFLFGWWLPTFAPLLAFVATNLGVTAYHYQDQKRIAFTDGLTKIANRRFFDRYIEQQWSKSQREKKDLAVILCDVDFFKVYNDTYGHQEGDVRLQKVALALNSSVRNVDLAARYGGEEFVVVLPDSNAKTAMLVADRIRSKLKKMQIPHKGSKASKYVSISMGIASLYNNEVISITELLAAADKALYQAKERGRDRAIVCQSENE